MMIPDGLVTTTGTTWNGSMEVYLRNCPGAGGAGGAGACSYSEALRFLLSFEANGEVSTGDMATVGRIEIRIVAKYL